jgi:hypothetical protein
LRASSYNQGATIQCNFYRVFFSREVQHNCEPVVTTTLQLWAVVSSEYLFVMIFSILVCCSCEFQPNLSLVIEELQPGCNCEVWCIYPPFSIWLQLRGVVYFFHQFQPGCNWELYHLAECRCHELQAGCFFVGTSCMTCNMVVSFL